MNTQTNQPEIKKDVKVLKRGTTPYYNFCKNKKDKLLFNNCDTGISENQRIFVYCVMDTETNTFIKIIEHKI